MRWGNQYELEACQAYLERTAYKGSKYGEEQEFLTYKEMVGATPDMIVEPNGGAEIKCPYNPGVHVMNCMIKNGEDLKFKNKDYYVQIQVQMLVTGAKWWDYVSYDPRLKIDAPDLALNVVKIERDEQFIIDLENTLELAIKKSNEAYNQLNDRIRGNGN